MDRLYWLIKYAAEARPCELRAQLNPPPVVIFTDGASEEKVSVGGVMFGGGRVDLFSDVVPEEVTQVWRAVVGSRLSARQNESQT